MEIKIFLTAFVVYLLARLYINLFEVEDNRPAFAVAAVIAYIASIATMAVTSFFIIWG